MGVKMCLHFITMASLAPASDCNLKLPVERSISTFLNITTIPLLFPLLLTSLAKQKNSPNTASSFNEEYDFIIVGAGAAGSVVAARLSEVQCLSVLLLEAGPPPPQINDVPAYAGFFVLSDLNWNYKTVPLKHTGRGLINRQAAFYSGKGLGGGTILNSMVYVRGNRRDYDNWAAMGAKGWSYKDILRYFKKMENNRDIQNLGRPLGIYDAYSQHIYHKRFQGDIENGYHGTRGPVSIMWPTYNSTIRLALSQAAKDMGYKLVDINARRETGFCKPQSYLRNNQRCSTAKAYLVPAENRTNLDILANAMVEKVIIEEGCARAVRFTYQGKTHEVKARKEVILSAGAVNTAKLLMLSGIGPKEELEKHNISVLADLPVGQNFQDHVGALMNFELDPHIKPFFQKITDPENVQRYIDNRTGPLCCPNGVSALAYLHNADIQSKEDGPNIELYLNEEIVAPIGNMNLEVYEKVYLRYQLSPSWLCISTVLQPRSYGNVTLRSADPNDDPLIDPNYLEDPRDVDDIVEGMKICKAIGTSHAMRSVGSKPFETLYPGCEKFAHDDDLYFRCQVQCMVIGNYHPAGTARMGDPRNSSTVVDPELRVKTIQGLRVADNSVMPKIISGTTAAPAIMIGEKAADMIKETIQCH